MLFFLNYNTDLVRNGTLRAYLWTDIVLKSLFSDKDVSIPYSVTELIFQVLARLKKSQ